MPKQPKYNSAQMEMALTDMQENGLSVRTIARKYGIPKSSIHFKLKQPNRKNTFGPSPVLTREEEQRLVCWISDLTKKGFPRKIEDLISSVQKFLEANPRPNPFRNNRPGIGWLQAFLKRNPRITNRQSEAVSSASACVTEADIRKWFSEVSEYFAEKNLTEVLEDPTRVFNGDETGFQICPSTGRVLAEKGSKNVYTIEQGSSKETITVMFTFSASGNICPPMIIYPYKRIPEKIIQSVPEHYGIGKSDNGWMTAEVFYEYIANVFHPYLLREKVTFPVILFVDGHKSHITYDLSILCNSLQIELIALYPNATRILQPADVAAFSPIKSTWRKIVRQFHMENPGETINKANIAPILLKIVGSVKSSTLINGFRLCGLCPFNADSVDYTKCLGSVTTNVNPQRNQIENRLVDMNERTINYNTFVEIVGADLIKKFEGIEHINGDGNLKKIYYIWRHFQQTQESIVNNSEQDVSNLTVSETLDPKATTHGIENETLLEDEQNVTDRMETSTPIPSCSTTRVASIAEEPQYIPSSSTSTQNISPLIKEITCGTSSQSLNISSLSPFLMWPHSPKRKNKRQTERTPYALTSEKYRKIFEAKRALEFEKAKQKEEKKKEREEKKQEVLAKKTAKLMKNKEKVLCGKCGKSIMMKAVSCSNCPRSFHLSCIPLNHRQHIPPDDDDEYLCHFCYKVDSDNNLSEMPSESDSEDNIDKLYAQYNTEMKKYAY